MNKRRDCLEEKLVPWGCLNVGKQKGVALNLSTLGTGIPCNDKRVLTPGP